MTNPKLTGLGALENKDGSKSIYDTKNKHSFQYYLFIANLLKSL
jgi:hypothetical protein